MVKSALLDNLFFASFKSLNFFKIVITFIIAVHVIVFFYIDMYALFILSVHDYVNCNAKTQRVTCVH